MVGNPNVPNTLRRASISLMPSAGFLGCGRSVTSSATERRERDVTRTWVCAIERAIHKHGAREGPRPISTVVKGARELTDFHALDTILNKHYY